MRGDSTRAWRRKSRFGAARLFLFAEYAVFGVWPGVGMRATAAPPFYPACGPHNVYRASKIVLRAKGGVCVHREDNRGLRFHVREQVHLPDDAPEIEAIRELELEPVVEVTASGGSVTVSGFLSLTGKYIGRREYLGGTGDGREAHVPFPYHPFESEMGPLAPWQKRSEIRHRIPLDITVPEDRVPDLEDVYVVIDSFDYEVNGPRKLLIDAVLDVTGIVVDSRRGAHTVEQDAPAAPVLVNGPEPAREAAGSAETATEGVAESTPDSHADDAPAVLREEKGDPVLDGHEAAFARVSPSVPEAGSGDEPTEQGASEAVKAAAAPAEAGDASARQGSDAAAEAQPKPQPEVKVAITAKSKTEESSARPLSSYLMEKLAKEKRPAGSDEQSPASAAPRASAEPNSTDGEGQAEGETTAAREGQEADAEDREATKRPENGRYLIGLLKEKEERYARLTMCIVQRDDTLASIAARYGVSVSTIRSVNRMADDRVEEGQILLIPRGEG